MGFSMDNFLRINDVPVDPPKPPANPKPTSAPVDASDRKFYVKAADNGNEQALEEFDAALAEQSKSPPPKPASASSNDEPKPHVKPERAEDPSDQKFYNMAADRENTIIDLENKAQDLNQQIADLPTDSFSGYVRPGLQAELDDIEARLAALQPQATGVDNASEKARDQPLSRADQLAQQHAPVLVLPGGDYDLPGDPQEFIDNSRLRTDLGGGRSDTEQGNNINGDPADEFTAADVGNSDGNGQFLDLADNRRNIGSEDAPIFYQFDDPDNPTRITYFFHYPYNDGPGPQNHEGDWEGITLALDPETGEPKAAFYSAHSNKHTDPVHFDDLEMYRDPDTQELTEKPLVYVASGSHASYPTPGNHQSDAPDARWFAGPILGDVINTQTLDDRTPNSVEEAAYIFDAGKNLHDIQEQDFRPGSGEGVHWGEPGNADGVPVWGNASSGPLGPSESKGHHFIADGSVTFLEAEQAYEQAEADYQSAERELRSSFYGPDSDGAALETASDRLVAAEEIRDEKKADLDRTKSVVLSEAEQSYEQAESDYRSARSELRSLFFGPNPDDAALEAASDRLVAAQEIRDERKAGLDQIKDISD